MSEATIPIKELMEKTEQWLLGQGYKKSTLGFYPPFVCHKYAEKRHSGAGCVPNPRSQ